jgi:hypothetical protein
MRIPRRKGGAAPLAVGAPSRKTQFAAGFALAALLGVSVLYDSAHIAATAKVNQYSVVGLVCSLDRSRAPTNHCLFGFQSEQEEVRAPPAQKEAESAATTGPTDLAVPPPPCQKEQQEAEDPAPTAGSSQQDAPHHPEQVVEHQQRHDEPCDLYRGRWVHDEARAPLYKEHECGFLTEQVTCMRNGRRDDAYQKWRWQPDGCDLPRCALASRALLPSFLAALSPPSLSFFCPGAGGRVGRSSFSRAVASGSVQVGRRCYRSSCSGLWRHCYSNSTRLTVKTPLLTSYYALRV